MSTERSAKPEGTPAQEAAPTGGVPKHKGTPPAKAGSSFHAKPRPAKRPLKQRVHVALRWLHIYISMFSLLAILFFSLTGITLNHPDWGFTNAETKRETKGQFPSNWKSGGQLDWLAIGEYLRAHDGVRGSVQDKEVDEEEGSITYKAPGYSADCFFNAKTGSYDLTVSAQGVVGVMNDFHRGTTAGSGWRWLIDVSGLMLTIVAITGLGLLYYLKKVRTAAFIAMGVGALIIAILMKIAF